MLGELVAAALERAAVLVRAATPGEVLHAGFPVRILRSVPHKASDLPAEPAEVIAYVAPYEAIGASDRNAFVIRRHDRRPSFHASSLAT